MSLAKVDQVESGFEDNILCRQVCPEEHTKVTLKTSCGDDRDACVDCKSVAEQMWVDSWPEKCYTKEQMLVLNQCQVTV